MTQVFGLDAYSPPQIAIKVRDIGVGKAGLPLLTLSLLGLLAGAFIGLGGLMFAVVTSDGSLGFAASRLLGGVAFSLGLLLVVVAGAELFTGNNLLVMAWAGGHVGTRALLRNWLVVGSANCAGAAGLAVLVWLSGHAAMNDGAVGRTVVQMAVAKAQLRWIEAFFRAILCNALVCMAVWMALAGRSVADKAMAVLFPVTAFVVAGFEHSIANMYVLSLGRLLGAPLGLSALGSLVPVIAGNIIGGSVFVALIYWMIYLRPSVDAAGRAGTRPVSCSAARP